MAQNFTNKIETPFAQNGTRTVIPQSSDDGSVSFDQGFGEAYAKPPASGGKYVKSQHHNYLFWLLTATVKELQEKITAGEIPVNMIEATNILALKNGGTGANNAQSASNNILQPVATSTTIGKSDFIYVYTSNAVKKITLANFNNVITASLPIGFIYFQLRGQSTPDQIFKTSGKWQDISSQYAGEFFRAVGGASASFGSTQNQGLPNITGGVLPASAWDTTSANQGVFKISNRQIRVANGAVGSGHIAGFELSAQKANSIFGASNHVTPYNSAIRIWKKIS